MLHTQGVSESTNTGLQPLTFPQVTREAIQYTQTVLCHVIVGIEHNLWHFLCKVNYRLTELLTIITSLCDLWNLTLCRSRILPSSPSSTSSTILWLCSNPSSEGNFILLILERQRYPTLTIQEVFHLYRTVGRGVFVTREDLEATFFAGVLNNHLIAVDILWLSVDQVKYFLPSLSMFGDCAIILVCLGWFLLDFVLGNLRHDTFQLNPELFTLYSYLCPYTI